MWHDGDGYGTRKEIDNGVVYPLQVFQVVMVIQVIRATNKS
jgi:hypothetical protein